MKYIIYCRKSSEAEDRQVLSIDSQEKELLMLAERDNLRISKVYKESMSAKAPGRPIFDLMLQLIEKGNGYCLLVWKLDRLARNALDGGKVSWFMDRGLITEIRTPEKVFRNISDDKFMMSLDFGIAKKYIDDLSTNVKRGNRAKLEKGGWPGPAPFGYLNNKADKTIIIDEKNKHYIRRIFELYATGGHSLIDVSNILYAEGLRTKSGLKIRRGHIHRIILNPFYFGIMNKNEKYYPGNHESIITKELYDRANYALCGNAHPKKQKHFFHLRGFLRCNNCGCMLTASKKKGHDYYYCTNGKGGCNEHQKYMRSEFLDNLIAQIFDKLKFDKELVDIAYEAAKEKTQSNQGYLETVKENFRKQLENTKQRQSRLLDSYLAELVSEDIYKAKIMALNNEQMVIESEIRKLNHKGPEESGCTLELIKNVFLRGNGAKKDYLLANENEKRTILEELLWNLYIKTQKVANCSFKMPYQLLAMESKPSDLNGMLRAMEIFRTCLMALTNY